MRQRVVFYAILIAPLALPGCAYTTPEDFDRPPACTSQNDPGLCESPPAIILCPEDPDSCRRTEKKAGKDDPFFEPRPN